MYNGDPSAIVDREVYTFQCTNLTLCWDNEMCIAFHLGIEHWLWESADSFMNSFTKKHLANALNDAGLGPVRSKSSIIRSFVWGGQ